VRLQLTDEVERSIAGAVQKFLAACTAAINQANNRTAEQALAMSNTTNATEVFDNDDKNGADLSDEIKKKCLLCLNNTASANRASANLECCNNGYCVNGECNCTKGWFNINLYFAITAAQTLQ